MKTLSSTDELLMLTVMSLKDDAYGVSIRQKVSKVTGKEWSIGAIYDPLYRLEDKGYVMSKLTEPTSERGGRSKRVFTVTEDGLLALKQQKKVRDELWEMIPGLTGK